jgi:DNA-binding NarL/FixJ family response regulator
MSAIRVVVVEDEEEIRELMEAVVSGEGDLSLVGSFASGEAAVKRIPELSPDVVLMDIHLGGMSGIECVRVLKETSPASQFLMCTVYEDDAHIYDSLKAGAAGYVVKSTPPSMLTTAIRELHAGGSPMTAGIARRVTQFFAQPTTSRMNTQADALSDREREVLNMLSQGFLYKEIADRLDISIDTIKRHCNHIYRKLQVGSRTDAVNKVFR